VPDTDSAISILRGIKEYETHHKVQIKMKLLLPLLNYRNATLQTVLPDKAIDLMDEAASKSEWKLTKPEELDVWIEK
jgi:ATP-dependent Clp protease ATP-binding subunit ClpA